MIKAYLAAALASAALAGSANAQGLFSFDEAEGGAFISGFAGSSSQGDAELSGPSTRLDAEFDSSAAYGVAAGYRLPFKYWTYFQPRLELEVSTSEADVSDVRVNGLDRAATGDISTTYFLFNNYNDISWSQGQTLVPFVGGGLGLAQIDLSLRESGMPGASIEDDVTAFATTFAGGLTWHASDRIELYGEARYSTVYGAEFDRVVPGGPARRALEDDLDAATFTAGARLRF